MLIPVRCFTCGKLLADKWEHYAAEAKRIDDAAATRAREAQPPAPGEHHQNLAQGYKGKLLDQMGLDRMCCRRHMITQVELIDII